MDTPEVMTDVEWHFHPHDEEGGSIKITDSISGVDPDNGDKYTLLVGERNGVWYSVIHNETTDAVCLERCSTLRDAMVRMDVAANDLTDLEDFL